jgi:hypothetical protein
LCSGPSHARMDLAVGRSGQAKLDRELSVVPATVITMTEAEQLMALASSTRLDPYCSYRPQFLGLPDANALLSSVDNDCRKGYRSRLLLMTDKGAAALYAPDHIYWEVYENLPRLARSSPVPVDDLRKRFEEHYLPVLRFVSVSTAEIVDPQVLAITDPDDVPLGQLAKLVAPCIVFSEDIHLRGPGLAPADWRLVAKFAIDLADGASMQRITGNVAITPARGVVALVQFLSRRTGLSPWLLSAGLVGGAVFLLWTPERREVVGRSVMPVIDSLAKMMEAAMAQERRGLEGLREVILPAPEAPTVKQQVAIILARQRGPLLAGEIHEHIQAHFSDEIVPTLGEVRTVLSGGPEFVQPERRRWQFGQQAGPWRR